MAVNLNDYENQNEPIPSGTRAMIQMKIEPPDHSKRSELSPALTKGNDDILYIKARFEIVSGPCAGRKFFQNFTVSGGKADEHGRSIAGKISGVTIKAMWDAHKNLMPTDMTQAAVAARQIKDYTDLDGIFFPAVVAVRAGNNGYGPKNEIYNIITPDKPEYNELRSGKDLEPLPIGTIGEGKNKTSGKPASVQPAWAQPAASALAQEAIPGTATGFNPPPSQTSTLKPAWAK